MAMIWMRVGKTFECDLVKYDLLLFDNQFTICTSSLHTQLQNESMNYALYFVI